MDKKLHEQVARDFFSALGRNDTAKMSELCTEDMTWWIVPGNKFSGLHSKQEFLGNLHHLFENASGNLNLDYLEITGEDDRLSIVAKGDLPMKDGRRYRSNYHFLLRFRDGKIVSGKEFLDSIHVNEIFGAPDIGTNAEIVKQYLSALQNGDARAMARFLAEDATYWIAPGTTFSGKFDKRSFLKLVDNLFAAQSEPLRLTYIETTAEGDRVALVVKGHMPLKSGGSYDNIYNWLFKLRSGKITEVMEFFDTMAVRKAFGAPEEQESK